MRKLRVFPGRGTRSRSTSSSRSRCPHAPYGRKNPDRGRAGWVPAHESRTTPTRRGARNQKQRGEGGDARAERKRVRAAREGSAGDVLDGSS